jgi:pimeloyl-ACP methyl ester carboxylesterase
MQANRALSQNGVRLRGLGVRPVEGTPEETDAAASAALAESVMTASSAYPDDSATGECVSVEHAPRRRHRPAPRRGILVRAMTTIDDALERDSRIPDLDWTVFPDGTVRDVFEAPSGGLARVSLGNPRRGRVVLIPGVTGSKEDFTLMFPLLADAGYRVESFDLAGQYESHAAGPQHLTPPRERYDYGLYIDDLVSILEADPTPAHVLGYSFAGLVAQLTLAERPELFASLTLLSTPPASGQVFRGVKRIGWLSNHLTPHQAAGLLIWGVSNNLNKVPPQRFAFVKSRFDLTRRTSVDDIARAAMSTPDITGIVRAAGIPKLVAVGAHDLWPTEQHADYAERIGADLAVYKTGHSPCETAPHQLVRDMLRAFDRT